MRERSTEHTEEYGNFFQISNAVVDEFGPIVGVSALGVYMVLKRHFNRKKKLSWPALKTIAEKTATTENTVRKNISILEAAGLITVFKKGGTHSNRYVINDVREVAPAEAAVAVKALAEIGAQPTRKTQSGVLSTAHNIKAFLHAAHKICPIRNWEIAQVESKHLFAMTCKPTVAELFCVYRKWFIARDTARYGASIKSFTNSQTAASMILSQREDPFADPDAEYQRYLNDYDTDEDD